MYRVAYVDDMILMTKRKDDKIRSMIEKFGEDYLE